MTQSGYRLARLPNGSATVASLEWQERMHPGLGPAAEAEALYVCQLRVRERMRRYRGEFVIWDVGLGGAANAIAVLWATRELSAALRLVSFDRSLEPLAFALDHAEALGYFRDYEPVVGHLLRAGSVALDDRRRTAHWELYLADFPSLMSSAAASGLPNPDAIFFDAYSPARNPAMWTLSLFEALFRVLNPLRPCTLATYSRSTMVRVAMLLAGFYVGRGRPSGQKEETTVAANRLELLDEPLDNAWLSRARTSGSAEPLLEPSYRQSPLTTESWRRLSAHLQFRRVSGA